MVKAKKPKNRLLALSLSTFMLDRFYLGKPISGTLKILTFGGLGLWWFVDGAMLLIDAFLYSCGKDTGMVKDGKGNELRLGLSGYRYKNGSMQKDWFS